jgi:hypothetical protein
MRKIYSRVVRRTCSAVLCIALMISAVVLAATWLQVLESGLWQAPLSLFSAGAVVGLVWDSRARTARRLHAVLDLYAEREIARETRRRTMPVERWPSP